MTKTGATTRIEGAGERAGRLRRRRIVVTMALLGLVGGVTGLLISLMQFQARHGGAIPAWVAVAGVAVLIIGTSWGSIVFFRQVDELERQTNYWAGNVSLYFYMLAYAGWYLLWKAAVVPEPSHEAMFAATFVMMGLSYAWKKFNP
jgi:hypothetical protein